MSEHPFAIPGLMEIETPKFDVESRWNQRLRSVRLGFKWDGIEEIIVTTLDDEPPTDDIVSAVMEFRRSITQVDADLTLRSSDSEIIIVSAASWLISVPSIAEFPLGLGLWYFRLLVTDVSGLEDVYVSGTINVTN